MNLVDETALRRVRKVGCFALVLLLFGLNVFLLLGAALGHCAPNADGTGCENDALIKFLMFPGFMFVSLAIIAVVGWIVLKKE